MEESMEFFAADSFEEIETRINLPLEGITQINGNSIVTRVQVDGDFDNWSGGFYPAELKVITDENGSVKTDYVYEEFTYIFEITSLPQMLDGQVGVPMECTVGDRVYLKFHEGKINNFLVCCKYEEHE